MIYTYNIAIYIYSEIGFDINEQHLGAHLVRTSPEDDGKGNPQDSLFNFQKNLRFPEIPPNHPF
jgi:hypothetical protein